MKAEADLHRGSDAELAAVARLRGLSLAGVRLASERGLLRFGKVCGFPCWLVTDRARTLAQARRTPRRPFPAFGAVAERKAHTLRSSRQCWPLGIGEAEPFPNALLDGATKIEEVHLRAALAFWDYCERSARWIFGTATGSRDADEVLAALRKAAAAGMTQTSISGEVFNRNRSAEQIAQALRLLALDKLAFSREEPTGGAPAHRWFATGHASAENGSQGDELNELNEVSPADGDLNSSNSFNSSGQHGKGTTREARP